jgi:hypothetical protein
MVLWMYLPAYAGGNARDETRWRLADAPPALPDENGLQFCQENAPRISPQPAWLYHFTAAHWRSWHYFRNARAMAVSLDIWAGGRCGAVCGYQRGVLPACAATPHLPTIRAAAWVAARLAILRRRYPGH